MWCEDKFNQEKERKKGRRRERKAEKWRMKREVGGGRGRGRAEDGGRGGIEETQRKQRKNKEQQTCWSLMGCV